MRLNTIKDVWNLIVAYSPLWAWRLYKRLRYGKVLGDACDECPICQENKRAGL